MDIAWEAEMKLAHIGLSKEGSRLVSHLARWFSDAHLLSGREGGANVPAIAVSNIIGAEPVITTTTAYKSESICRQLPKRLRCRGGKEDTINTAKENIQRGDSSRGQGKLFVVGIGPGGPLHRTHHAEQAIAQSTVVVGYTRYLKLIEDLTVGKELIASGMKQETERCRAALGRARGGETVALVSSGDPGIYGMAGLAIELAATEAASVPVEIIPGVSAANATAARLGAALMLDFATISLSDLLVPWETIRARLEAVAAADLVVALYNPRSKKRVKQLEEAALIFRGHRPETTPVGVGTAVGTPEERVVLSDLAHFLEVETTMRSVILIGNRTSRCIGGWFLTPRGYQV